MVDHPLTSFKMLNLQAFGKLDAEMKRLKSARLGSKPEQAKPLSEEDEEKLWHAGQGSRRCPEALLNIHEWGLLCIVYSIGNCA